VVVVARDWFERLCTPRRGVMVVVAREGIEPSIWATSRRFFMSLGYRENTQIS